MCEFMSVFVNTCVCIQGGGLKLLEQHVPKLVDYYNIIGLVIKSMYGL